MRLIDADVLKQHIDKLPALPDGNFAGNHSALKALINMQPTIQLEKAQLFSECATSDTISRQAVIDELRKFKAEIIPYEKARIYVEETVETMYDRIVELPSIQPEPSILLSWVEKYIEWLRSLDNEFANLAAAHISVMVKKWRDEQDETD